MVINTDHKLSISRNYDTLQPQLKVGIRGALWLAALALAGGVSSAWGTEKATCAAALGAPLVRQGPLRTVGTTPAAVDIAVLPGHTYLIEVSERDNDALVEVLDSGKSLASAEHPERRTGTRRAVVRAPESGALTVRVTGEEHAKAAGVATVRVYDVRSLELRPDCLGVFRTLAQADGDYAAGEEVSRGHAASQGGNPHDAFVRAATGYAAAARALAATGDQQLEGETELALAGIEYLGLHDWARAADEAKSAADTFGTNDPYRRARAQALLAESWIEIGRVAPAGNARTTQSGADLLGSAVSLLRRLTRFHLARGETYDAGLQLNYTAVALTYQSRYTQCIAASAASARLFESISETLHLAQSWQDQAMCLWGLGRIPEARRWFERARGAVAPESYPSLYLGVTNNTALLDYALGDLDAALELFDRALSFEKQTGALRDEAQSLYGIGVTYYALGDPDRAREFLDSSLSTRTAALDRRGRMNTLRALATIDAEQGRAEEAIRFDREALGLAVAPTSIERITIQLAAHTAAAGRLEDAKAQLDAFLSRGQAVDPASRAESLLQRAVVLRELGRPARGARRPRFSRAAPARTRECERGVRGGP